MRRAALFSQNFFDPDVRNIAIHLYYSLGNGSVNTGCYGKGFWLFIVTIFEHFVWSVGIYGCSFANEFLDY